MLQVANSWIHNYLRNKPYDTPMLRESSIPIHQNADTRLTSWVISCILRAKEARMDVSSSTINKEILFKFLSFFKKKELSLHFAWHIRTWQHKNSLPEPVVNLAYLNQMARFIRPFPYQMKFNSSKRKQIV